MTSFHTPFGRVAATPEEHRAPRPGDEIVPHPDVVLDRGFDLAASPEIVWPWLVQLGKARAGWYLSRRVERWIPPRRRATRRLEPRFQALAVGDVIPDWGGRDARFEVALMQPPTALVHRSTRGRTELSWAITVTPLGPSSSRVHLRLRLAPVRRPWLGRSVGGMVDLLTVAGLAVGLQERLRG